jgi:hypothetical protein
VQLDGVLDVVWARVRWGARKEVAGIVDVMRVGQDLYGKCRGSVQGWSSCGLGRKVADVEGQGVFDVQFGKGKYVDAERTDGGEERFGWRGTLRVSVLRRFREPSGLLNAERFEEAKLRLQGERLFV